MMTLPILLSALAFAGCVSKSIHIDEYRIEKPVAQLSLKVSEGKREPLQISGDAMSVPISLFVAAIEKRSDLRIVLSDEIGPDQRIEFEDLQEGDWLTFVDKALAASGLVASRKSDKEIEVLEAREI